MVALSKKITPISLGIIFLISAVLLFAWLDTVPGLHGDEAWVGLRANDIVRGDRPLLGMNGYTGSLHQYFAAFAFRFFGMKVWSLRCLDVDASSRNRAFFLNVWKNCERSFHAESDLRTRGDLFFA
jgi:hypothetical protein